MTPSRRSIALGLLSALLVGSAAQAQSGAGNFPNRPLKIVVPFPAGGPSDVLARMIGQKMSQDFGQSVVVENRPGANTVIAASQVVATHFQTIAAANGYWAS